MESTAQYWKSVWETLERYWKPICEKRKGARMCRDRRILAQNHLILGRLYPKISTA